MLLTEERWAILLCLAQGELEGGLGQLLCVFTSVWNMMWVRDLAVQNIYI